MLTRYPKIILYKGATSVVKLDLSNTQMNGGYFVLTIKETNNDDPIKEMMFDESKIYDVVFEDDFTKNLSTNKSYQYDIMYHLDGERFPQCKPSPIVVYSVVGGLVDE